MPPGRRPGQALPTQAGRKGRPWRRIREYVLGSSTMCIYCGHEGSSDVDHILPRDKYPELAEELSNLGPIHGNEGRCYICDPIEGRNCNREKSNGDVSTILNTTEDWLG